MKKKFDIEDFNIEDLTLEELEKLTEDARKAYCFLLLQLRLRKMSKHKICNSSK